MDDKHLEVAHILDIKREDDGFDIEKDIHMCAIKDSFNGCNASNYQNNLVIHMKECESLVCGNPFKDDKPNGRIGTAKEAPYMIIIGCQPLYQSVHKKGRVHSISIGDKLMYSIKTRLSPFMFK